MKYYCYPKLSPKQSLIRGGIAFLLIVAILLAILLPLILTGNLQSIDSVSELKDLILSGKIRSLFIFALLQFLQVTFIPIPSVLTTLAGTLIFGPWLALTISLFSILIGSLFAFSLGRKLGKNLIFWVAGYRKGNVLINKISRGKYLFFLMMLFPFFPDDLLCLVAGVTNMSYKFFILTNLVCRPLALIPICFIGSGNLIPFSGWGVPVWIILILVILVLFVLSVKYQPQIENFFTRLLKRKKLLPQEEEKKCLLKSKHLFNKYKNLTSFCLQIPT